MSSLKQLETKLSPMFRGMPAMPNESKESLVKAWPWIALILGVIQLLLARGLWNLIHRANILSDYVNGYYQAITGRKVGLSGFDKSMLYLGMIVLLVDAVIYLMAFPKLQKRQRGGWDLVFMAAVVNLVYAVLSLFLNGQGIGSFLGSLVASFVGFYLLFQVRDKYSSGSAPTPTAPTQPTDTPPATE